MSPTLKRGENILYDVIVPENNQAIKTSFLTGYESIAQFDEMLKKDPNLSLGYSFNHNVINLVLAASQQNFSLAEHIIHIQDVDSLNAQCALMQLIDYAGKSECCNELIELLINKGVDINQATRNGFLGHESALFNACKHGNGAIAKLLIEKGAFEHYRLSPQAAIIYHLAYNTIHLNISKQQFEDFNKHSIFEIDWQLPNFGDYGEIGGALSVLTKIKEAAMHTSLTFLKGWEDKNSILSTPPKELIFYILKLLPNGFYKNPYAQRIAKVEAEAKLAYEQLLLLCPA